MADDFAGDFRQAGYRFAARCAGETNRLAPQELLEPQLSASWTSVTRLLILIPAKCDFVIMRHEYESRFGAGVPGGIFMVQAVHRAVQALKELATGTQRLGVSELANRLEVAKPTAHALLRTLESEGLVTQDRETSKYQLGPGLVTLGNAYLDSHKLRIRAVTWADILATRTGCAVWVGVLVDRQVLVIHHAFRPGATGQTLETGANLPWNACALGKAIAAFLPPAQRAPLLSAELARVTGASIDDPDVLEAQLCTVREVGYALDNQEATLGDASIAAPVFDHTGEVTGAIALVGPVERFLSDPARHEGGIATREIARSLSRDLGAPRNAGLSADPHP
ncbi:IclR family transcriptional regulator [Streptomyces chryseus]